MHTYTENINIESTEVLLTPSQVKTQLPLSDALQKSIIEHRKTLQNILDGKDQRLFVVVGPCSIHDPVAAIDYAKKLKKLACRSCRHNRLGDACIFRKTSHHNRLERPD